MKNAQPIKPEEISQIVSENIPDDVIETVNVLVAENWDGKRAKFDQDKLVETVLAVRGYIEGVQEDYYEARNLIFKNKELNFEPIFREAGWKVEFDKPGYNEKYTEFWIFQK